MHYRFYLVDEEDRFRAAESFAVGSDSAAIQVASAVYSACSDVFDGYELWRGTERIAKRRHTNGVPSSHEVAELRQTNVLDLEERLQATFACVRNSKKLLEATEHLRMICTAGGSESRSA